MSMIVSISSILHLIGTIHLPQTKSSNQETPPRSKDSFHLPNNDPPAPMICPPGQRDGELYISRHTVRYLHFRPVPILSIILSNHIIHYPNYDD
jgi:hypothetical protein